MIPASAAIPICIEQGSIYHYKLQHLNHDGTPYIGDRFFIVLNINPKTDTALVLVTITKKIENQEKHIKVIGESLDTLVRITPADFQPLSVDSCVNCNNTYEVTLSELIKKVDNGGKIFFEKLPKNIITDLVSGVMKSNQVPNYQKKLII